MEQELIKNKLLYIGTDTGLIAFFEQSLIFQVLSFPNTLQAVNWLSDGKFYPFTNENQNYEIVNKPYAILCESNLLGMSGFDFYKELSQNSFFDQIPFILITDKFRYVLREQARQMGIDDYFEKPIRIERLAQRLEFLTQFKKLPKQKEKQKIEIKTKITPYETPLIKRIFDVSSASVALLILSPLFLIIAAAIRIESKGKVFYASKRVGANFKTFDFYKFRSMYPDADARLKDLQHLNQYKDDAIEIECSECAKLPEGHFCSPVVYYDKERICERMAIKRRNAKKAFLKIVNDPRITKIGNFIRATSIDELPQLVNVIKGDMSVVGNRPLPVNEANAITKSKWSRRFHAAAGLTGLWQVELRGKGGIMSEEERFLLDNQYAENNSFWGDIKLILKTIPALLQKENV